MYTALLRPDAESAITLRYVENYTPNDSVVNFQKTRISYYVATLTSVVVDLQIL
jgi:hypothetical protein